MMKLRSPLMAVSLLCLVGTGEGYSTTTTTYRQSASPSINSSTRLGMSDNDGFKSSFTPVSNESILREEIKNKNENQSVGKDFAIADNERIVDGDEGKEETNSSSVVAIEEVGESLVLEVIDEVDEVTAPVPVEVGVDKDTINNVNDKNWEKEIKRAIKPRAYPLFLLEKAATIIDELASRKDTFKVQTREKVLVLGTGWGSAAFLKDIDTSICDVTVISPRNYFLFTPMLAGASVGTVEYRSITEPIREINRNVDYLEATATDIDPRKRIVTCQNVVCEGNSCVIEDFEVEYDRLVVGVGAQTNTFGIPGVRENCCFLKQIDDARKIRNSIVNCFERANIPSMSEEVKSRALTFVVIGAGPTGIEFASELRDFIEQDGAKYYPELIKYVSIKIIEATNTVLAPFDKSLQEAAIEQLLRPSSARYDERISQLPSDFTLTELLLESGVKEVKETAVYLNNGKEIPYGLSVWAAGNGPLPITLQLIDNIGEGEQADAQNISRGRLAIDPWCRVLGTDGTILSFGDCSCNTDNFLPATAQVASQQGAYLARLFGKGILDAKEELTGKLLPVFRNKKVSVGFADRITAFATQSSNIAAPFQFLNLGILAYTGSGTALSQLQVTPKESNRLKGKGTIGFGLWRSVYLSKQVSLRNRALVLTDWLKAQVFGRDITRLD